MPFVRMRFVSKKLRKQENLEICKNLLNLREITFVYKFKKLFFFFVEREKLFKNLRKVSKVT